MPSSPSYFVRRWQGKMEELVPPVLAPLLRSRGVAALLTGRLTANLLTYEIGFSKFREV